MKKFYVYVLLSRKNGRVYIGQTADLKRRLQAHNRRVCRSTKPYCPWAMVYNEPFRSRSQAVIRERYLKSGAGRKFLKTVLR